MANDTNPPTDSHPPEVSPLRTGLVLGIFLVAGAGLSYLDHRLKLETMLVEAVHAVVVTAILVFCLIAQRRYPEIRRFGWDSIVWGVAFLTVGSWVDLLDDPPLMNLFSVWGVPFGRSWQQAFLKKIVGYTAGIGLMAFGFSQWVPWMIETRFRVQQLNKSLGQTNQKLNRTLMSLDDHIESERLNISRELHDEVAQQLTYIKVQTQLCEKMLTNSDDKAREQLKAIGTQVSEALASVRQISQDLRPEALYALGLIPALEQFLERMRSQHPEVTFFLEHRTPPDWAESKSEAPLFSLESRLSERDRLHLFRVIQEGVRNAVKHSGANTVTVALDEKPDLFKVSVEDNGQGLPWETLPTDEVLVQEGHLGLVGLQERVREIGGTFRLVSQPMPGARTHNGARMEVCLSK